MGKEDVSVIIPNFNGKSLMEKNLPKVIASMGNHGNNISEIIVVDDASSDGSSVFVKTSFSGVKLIQHKKNRGFSGAVNTGVRAAHGSYVAILNTDVVPSENFLLSVIPHFDNRKVFGVSLHEKGYGWAKGKFADGYIVHEPGEEDASSHETFWISGGSGIFRKEYWSQLGGLDEKLFSPFYWEDLDISYRALKRGFTNLWEPTAEVVHEHEATIRRFPKKYTERIRERNQLLFIWKNLTSQNMFRKHIAGLIKRVVQHPGYLRIVLMAAIKINQVIPARKKEKKEAKISDEAIFARFK